MVAVRISSAARGDRGTIAHLNGCAELLKSLFNLTILRVTYRLPREPGCNCIWININLEPVLILCFRNVTSR